MFLFALGFGLGYGLSLIIQSINKTRQLRHINRKIEEERAFNARVAQAMALANSWGQTDGHAVEFARPAGPSDW